MHLRKDFQTAEFLFARLDGIGKEFYEFNLKRWPHLKNNEDFHTVYSLPLETSRQLDELYGTGRDIAVHMSDHLRDFNDYTQYPTLGAYVDSFDAGWVSEAPDLHGFVDGIRALTKTLKPIPWAVEEMIRLFDIQLTLIAAVRETIALLKKTHIYLVEKGKASVEQSSMISIGSVNGKVNIHSTDNSQDNSTQINVDPIFDFDRLSKAVADSAIRCAEKTALQDSIAVMKQAAGTPGFLDRYKDFIQTAANHMTVIGPFLPHLTMLLR